MCMFCMPLPLLLVPVHCVMMQTHMVRTELDLKGNSGEPAEKNKYRRIATDSQEPPNSSNQE